MKKKAQANLEASRRLLEAKLVDPAMSRLYYSLFQAGVHAMDRLGKTPRELSRSDVWEHGVICGNASMYRSQPRDFHLFRNARDLREQADYQAIPVERRRVLELLPEVDGFLKAVCP